MTGVDIDDLLPSLSVRCGKAPTRNSPITCVTSSAFQATVAHIRITPPGTAGRSAVAIEGPDGAIIFVLTPNPARAELLIVPIVAGPICRDADIVRRATESSGDDNSTAITMLMARHLVLDVARESIDADGALRFPMIAAIYARKAPSRPASPTSRSRSRARSSTRGRTRLARAGPSTTSTSTSTTASAAPSLPTGPGFLRLMNALNRGHRSRC